MPIGVPRIIYCWGEELPAQWTDIYNFIFRRRMVFLMQYLDDELCNQICGLLINVHMEDRSKELEKKEMERSGLFKGSTKQTPLKSGSKKVDPSNPFLNGDKKEKSVEDLLGADEDLGIEDNNTLEQYTLQKITMEWLNWNAQFFDYSDEPYLFYLAELLSKDFSKNEGRMLRNGDTKEMSRLMMMFKTMTNSMSGKESSQFKSFKKGSFLSDSINWQNTNSTQIKGNSESNSQPFDVYSPFRLLSNFASQDYSLKDLNSVSNNNWGVPQLLEVFNQTQTLKPFKSSNGMTKLLSDLSQKKFIQNSKNHQKVEQASEKALGQRKLRKEYTQDKIDLNLGFNSYGENRRNRLKKSSNYLDFSSYNDSYNQFRDYYRKQTERALSEEESKKVFVIINSFGGSVGNGITVHDALQFIKAGSLTLALGVAASAASLALAGGTIGERYVTEGCHTMIHQPECVTPDHEVLTTNGWIPITEVTLNHKLATLNKEGELLYENPTKIHQYQYAGDLYCVKVTGVNLKVTPNHRMFVASRALDRLHTVSKPFSYFQFKEASEILNKKVRYKKDAVWAAPDYQFILPSITKYTYTVPAKKMPMKPWLILFGLWIAEGCTTKFPDTHYYSQITQKKPHVCAIIENLIKELGFKLSKSIHHYRIHDKQLWSYLEPLSVGALNKSLPDWVWNLSSEQCKFLLEGLILGDGYININDQTEHYFTGSLALANDVCRLCLHAGYSASMGLEDLESRKNRLLNGVQINTNNPLWKVNILKRNTPYANYKPINSQTKQEKFDDWLEPYEGPVHCVTMPQGLFYVRREGSAVWTGNSSIQGQASDIWIDSQEIMKIKKDVAEIYSLATYRPKHKVLRDLDRDFYLTATETVHYGLADEIATNEVMHEIIEMTNNVWDYHNAKQQTLMETHANTGEQVDTKAQN